MPKFKEGDRVIRKPIDKFSSIRRGKITKVGHSYRDWMNQSHVVYTVLWDDTGREESGYLEITNGLEIEPT